MVLFVEKKNKVIIILGDIKINIKNLGYSMNCFTVNVLCSTQWYLKIVHLIVLPANGE